MRRPLFLIASFLMLAFAAAASPGEARAFHCNNTWCDRYGGQGCMEGFPGTHCLGGGDLCYDDIC